jgi:4-hydroxybenzoate polyprenyltransferase
LESVLSNVILKPSFAAILFLAATLYIYATSLKQMLLLGNIVCSIIIV